MHQSRHITSWRAPCPEASSVLVAELQEDVGSSFENISYSDVVLSPRDQATEDRTLQHLKVRCSRSFVRVMRKCKHS